MRDLAGGPRRFVELQRVLPGISTEQLRSRLNRMVADGLLTRQRYREVPPRVDYELTERAQGLMPVIGALARWGYEWAWSGPRDGEEIDIGAILRVAPGLLHPPKSVKGTLVVEATAKQGKPRVYTLTASRGDVSIAEAAPDAGVEGDAHVSGSHDAWVSAFSPNGGSRSALKVTGDKTLAATLLDGLISAGAQAAAA